MISRCFGGNDPIYITYHDEEWGVPNRNDRHLFEMLILEGAQAGLSWSTVLNKRQNYRKAFDNFDAQKIARYNAKKIKALLGDAGIIRNRLKIESAIQNAKAYLKVREEFGTFDAYIWQFVGGKPKVNRWRTFKEIPARCGREFKRGKDVRSKGDSFRESKRPGYWAK